MSGGLENRVRNLQVCKAEEQLNDKSLEYLLMSPTGKSYKMFEVKTSSKMVCKVNLL